MYRIRFIPHEVTEQSDEVLFNQSQYQIRCYTIHGNLRRKLMCVVQKITSYEETVR